MECAAIPPALKGGQSTRQQASYETCRAGLTAWARNKEIVASRAPNAIWEAAGLEVKVNPELRLAIEGEKYAVKLYFKAPEMSTAREETLLFLLGETAPRGVEAAVLDVRRGKLITSHGQDPNLEALLISDAAAFAALA